MQKIVAPNVMQQTVCLYSFSYPPQERYRAFVNSGLSILGERLCLFSTGFLTLSYSLFAVKADDIDNSIRDMVLVLIGKAAAQPKKALSEDKKFRLSLG